MLSLVICLRLIVTFATLRATRAQQECPLARRLRTRPTYGDEVKGLGFVELCRGESARRVRRRADVVRAVGRARGVGGGRAPVSCPT